MKEKDWTHLKENFLSECKSKRFKTPNELFDWFKFEVTSFDKTNKYPDFIERFNEVTGRKIRVLGSKEIKQINARIKEGFTIGEILYAANNCSKDKFHIENPHFLTPEFITRLDKLQKYLNGTKINKTDNSFRQDFVERASKNSY